MRSGLETAGHVIRIISIRALGLNFSLCILRSSVHCRVPTPDNWISPMRNSLRRSLVRTSRTGPRGKTGRVQTCFGFNSRRVWKSKQKWVADTWSNPASKVLKHLLVRDKHLGGTLCLGIIKKEEGGCYEDSRSVFRHLSADLNDHRD